MKDDDLIERYHPADRANHWLTAITFILLAASGLALFHPAFFFLSHLFGGGPWMRILHPFIGVVMAVSFYFLAHRFLDRKSTRLNSSHDQISYAVFCLKKKTKKEAESCVWSLR